MARTVLAEGVAAVSKDVRAEVEYVLVVDDSATSRTALVELLAEEGIYAVGLGDGAQALDFLASARPPRAILTDLMMPDVDGWRLVERMKADERLCRVPVIIMTASPFAPGPRGLPLLRKPFRVHELLTVLRQIA